MSIEAAFLSPAAADLFSSVAAYGDAQVLELLDVSTDDSVTEGQRKARQIIDAAIANALDPRRRGDPSSRIALIKGTAGSGKSHVLTTSLKRAATTQEVYPAVLQLTAPVGRDDYEAWLIEATFRQLSTRNFADISNHSPLRRLGGRLLDQLDLQEQESFMTSVIDIDDPAFVEAALRAAKRIRRLLLARGADYQPSAGFIAVVIMAGFGDYSAFNYLARGQIDNTLSPLNLDHVSARYQRINVLIDLGRVAQIANACLVLGFDQVENVVRLADTGTFVHSLIQAVRIAEAVSNCAVILASVQDEYDVVVALSDGLPVSDRDRIERDGPTPAVLGECRPDFLRAVISQRLAVLRDRVGLPQSPGSLAPLPDWFATRVLSQSSVRLALREVNQFRDLTLQDGRLPNREDLPNEDSRKGNGGNGEDSRDFDKEWADFQDLNLATVRLPDRDKGAFVAWWVEQASRENLASAPAKASLTQSHDGFETPVIDITLKVDGAIAERRQVAICDAPNRTEKLPRQLQGFLEAVDGATPAALRTNGFPKGARTLVAAALRQLETLGGLKIDLVETEWQNLRRAREFTEQREQNTSFLAWRQDRQWLTRLVVALQPLIAPPVFLLSDIEADTTTQADQGNQAIPASERKDRKNRGEETVPSARHKRGQKAEPVGGDEQAEGKPNRADGRPLFAPFPVHIGESFDGMDIAWDPYRKSPDALNNYGFVVTGDAGSGKTQTIRVLIEAACKQDLPLTIFDFKADYCDSAFAAALGIQVIDVRTQGLPFNPMQPPPRGASGAQPIEYAFELAEILRRVFRLGAVQEGTLRDAIAQVYQQSGINPQEWIDPASVAWPSFDLVLDHLRQDSSARALVTKLSILTALRLFGGGTHRSSFETFLQKRVCLKLSDLATDEIKSALAEILIVQLHAHALRGEQPRRLARMMVFDEAHRVKDSKRLEMLAREGRAFGIGIVIGTQYPGDIPESTAGSLATQLFLMNKQADHRQYVVEQILGTTATPEAKKLLDRLGHLAPLEGLFSNSHHQRAFVRVLPYFARSHRPAA